MTTLPPIDHNPTCNLVKEYPLESGLLLNRTAYRGAAADPRTHEIFQVRASKLMMWTIFALTILWIVVLVFREPKGESQQPADQFLTPDERRIRFRLDEMNYKNKNGESRKEIVKRECRKGDEIGLVREKNLLHRREAIAVYHLPSGKQIGYVPPTRASQIALHFKAGREADAYVKHVIENSVLVEVEIW